MLSFLIFILILSILIIAHEFGHFLVAKKSGVKVEKFSIGFGPPLLKIKGKETEFLIGLVPLGGYVKLAGDNISEYQGYPFEFLSKPIRIRAKIVFSGPLFNYLMAFALFWLVALLGFPYLDTVVGKVLDDFPAKKIGLEEGDRILEVNGKKVNYWQEMSKEIRKSKDKVYLKVKRDNRLIYFTVPLEKKKIEDEFGKKKEIPMIGIAASSKIKIVKYNFLEGFFKGIQSIFFITFIILKGIFFIIFGILPFKEAVTGPLGIYYVTSEATKIGITAILHLMAVLNVSLTIVNLLPLPLLDGGHLFVFLIEKIRKKRWSQKAEEWWMRLGFLIVSFLILFVFYNDIVKFGSKIWKKENIQQKQ
jgi:regulator of sigma E protease